MKEITVDRAMEFLDIVQEVRYEKGERIIEQGTRETDSTSFSQGTFQ
jgi:hypothetical protein